MLLLTDIRPTTTPAMREGNSKGPIDSNENQATSFFVDGERLGSCSERRTFQRFFSAEDTVKIQNPNMTQSALTYEYFLSTFV